MSPGTLVLSLHQYVPLAAQIYDIHLLHHSKDKNCFNDADIMIRYKASGMVYLNDSTTRSY